MTDASKSSFAGNGILPVQTAGISVKFSIFAHDSLSVRKTSGGDIFDVVATSDQTSISGSVVDRLDGSYEVVYAFSKSGAYSVNVDKLSVGGLRAEYFENVWLFYTPSDVVIEKQVSHEWGNGQALSVGPDFFSVRWTGRIKSPFSEAFTFYVEADDSAKVWINDVLVIDCWDVKCGAQGSSMVMSANRFYNFRMEYKELEADAYVRLLWKSKSVLKEVVPPDHLFYAEAVHGSPVDIEVVPGRTSPTACLVKSDSLSTATAGTLSRLVIIARDVFGNLKTQGGDLLFIQILTNECIFRGYWLPSVSCNERKITKTSVQDNLDGTYEAQFVVLEAERKTQLYLDLLEGCELSATYYDASNFPLLTATKEILSDGQLRFCNQTDVPCSKVKVGGAIKSAASDSYRFSIDTFEGMSNFSVAISLDQSDILQESFSPVDILTSSEVPMLANDIYDFLVTIRIFDVSTSTSSSFRLSWEATHIKRTHMQSCDTFRKVGLQGSPYLLNILPSQVCSSKSFVSLNENSLAPLDGSTFPDGTAGKQISMIVVAKDQFDNPTPFSLTSDPVNARLVGVDTLAGNVISTSNESCRISFTATRAGTYDVRVAIGTSLVYNSPFRLNVRPSHRSIRTSSAVGEGLTLTTAGHVTRITITARDTFGNVMAWNPKWTEKFLCTFVEKGSGLIVQSRTAFLTYDRAQPESPNLELQYQITRAGEYLFSVAGTSSMYDGIVGGLPFFISVQPSFQCATSSYIEPVSFSVATAGVTQSFKVYLRDQYGNDVSANKDTIYSALRVPKDSNESMAVQDAVLQATITNDPSLIELTCAPSLSTSNLVSSTLLVRGGLWATYYLSSMAFEDAQTSALVTQNIEEADASNISFYQIFMDGVILPQNNTSYLFSIGTNSTRKDFCYEIWLNNILVSEVSDISCNKNASFVQNVIGLRDVFSRVEARLTCFDCNLSASQFSLAWAANSSNFSSIPSSRMYRTNEIRDSPYSLPVRPSEIASNTSFIVGESISLTTAGIASSFQVIAKDRFGNDCETLCEGLCQMEFFISNISPKEYLQASSELQDDWNSLLIGNKLRIVQNLTLRTNATFEYRLNETGTFELFGRLLKTGGLQGMYFENTDFTDHGLSPNGSSAVPSYSRVDETIDFDWKKTQRPVPAPEESFKDIGPDFFSVRWSGLVIPPATAVWTFKMEVPAASGAKLLVDDLLIFSIRHDFLGQTASFIEGTIALMSQVMYPIRVEYQRFTQDGPIRLLWKSQQFPEQVISNRYLAHWSSSEALRSSLLIVEAGKACAGQSFASGIFLSIATAGTLVSFTIRSRDAYGNERRGPDNGITPFEWSLCDTVRSGEVLQVISATEIQLDSTTTLHDKAFVDMYIHFHETGENRRIIDSLHNGTVKLETPTSLPSVSSTYVIYNPAVKSVDRLRDLSYGEPDFFARYVSNFPESQSSKLRLSSMSSLSFPGGLSATYYSSHEDNALPIWSTSCLAGSPCQEMPFENTPLIESSRRFLSSSLTETYRVDFEGSISFPDLGEHNFSIDTSSSVVNVVERVKLWIDNVLLIDQWTSLRSMNLTFSLNATAPYPVMYPIKIAFSSYSNSTNRILPLRWTNYAKNQSFYDLPSSSLYGWSGNHIAYGVVTLAGTYQSYVSLALAQSLYATFYTQDDPSTPIETRVVNSYKTNAVITEPLPSNWNIIRWKGLLRPKFVDLQGLDIVFTFRLSTTAHLPNIRFWLDNQIVMDSTDKEDLIVLEGVNQPFQASPYYDFTLEYFSGSTLTDDWVISWKQCSSSTCDDSFTDIESSLFGDWIVSSYDGVAVKPGLLCASTSFLELPEIQYASAGENYSFSLIAQDQFGNRRSEGGDEWIAWMLPADVWESMQPIQNSTSFACAGCQISYGVGTDAGDGTYSFSVATNKTGVYKLMVQNLAQEGLSATYYSLDQNEYSMILSSKSKQSIQSIGNFSDLPATLCIIRDINCTQGAGTGTDPFGAVWKGFVKGLSADEYTFSLSLSNSTDRSERLKLWVDGRILIDQWSSLSRSDLFATISFGSVLSLHPIQVEYRFLGNTSGTPSLSFAIQDNLRNESVALFSAYDVYQGTHSWVDKDTGGLLKIVAGQTNASLSRCFGSALTLATAGVESTLRIRGLDSYGNLVERWDDTWAISLASSTTNEESSLGDYLASYQTSIAGTFDLSIQHLKAGGLLGMIYDNEAFSGQPMDVNVSNIDFDWQNGPVHINEWDAQTIKHRSYMEDYVSATWEGFLMLDIDDMYYFYIQAGKSDQVKLTIDQTDFLWTGCEIMQTSCYEHGLQDASVAMLWLKKQSIHSIKIEYKHHVGEAHLSLKYASTSWEKDLLLSDAVTIAGRNDDQYLAHIHGFLRTKTSSTSYLQFQNIYQSLNDRIKVWFDGELVIDQWNSLSESISGISGTFDTLLSYELYEIVIDYKFAFPTQPRLILSGASLNSSAISPSYTSLSDSTFYGESLSVATAGVPASFTVTCRDSYANARDVCTEQFSLQITDQAQTIQLYSGSFIGNTGNYVATVAGTYSLKISLGSDIKQFVVNVHPGTTSSASCEANGVSLTIATAGFGATFSIQSKDSFLNLRTNNDDVYRIFIQGADNEHYNARAEPAGLSPNTLLGQSTVSYRMSKSGEYSLNVLVASDGIGGLNLACHEDDSFLSPFYTATAGVDVRWASNGICQSHSGNLASTFARWSGFISSQYAEEHTYIANIGSATERLKLWIDNAWIIDQWTSLGATHLLATVWMVRDVMVDIKIEYKTIANFGSIELSWSSVSQPEGPIPTSRLFFAAEHIHGSPFQLAVYPANTCGSLSTAYGASVSLATAGLASYMTIQARDHLGNNVSSTDDVFLIHARTKDLSNIPDISGTVSSLGDGVYKAGYIPTTKSSEGQELFVQLAIPGGLMATYYDESNFTHPARTIISPTVMFESNASCLSCWNPDGNDLQAYSIRYEGFISPPGQQRYTFSTEVGGSDERVRLWINNVMVIDQWLSISSIQPSGTFFVDNGDQLYSLSMEYQKVPVNLSMGSLSLHYEYQSLPRSPIASSRLFQSYNLFFVTAGGPGLRATYYSLDCDGTYNGVAVNAAQEEAFSWSSWTYPQISNFSFQVRWAGLLQMTPARDYTFWASFGENLSGDSTKEDRISLWIDGEEVIAQWSSLQTTIPSGTFHRFGDDRFYRVEMKYKHACSAMIPLFPRLFWKYQGQSPDQNDSQLVIDSAPVPILPSSRLFISITESDVQRDDFDIWNSDYYDSSSPFNENRQVPSRRDVWAVTTDCPLRPGSSAHDRCRGQGLRLNSPLVVQVEAGAICATKSVLSGAGLVIASAGIPSYFSIVALDAYSNQRDTLDDTFNFRISFDSSFTNDKYNYTVTASTTPVSASENRQMVVDSSHVYDNFFEGQYTVTISGFYNLYMSCLSSEGNGLFAVYFDGSIPFQGYRSTRVDPNINFEWGNEPPALYFAGGGKPFSVMWTGYIQPNATGNYFFMASSDGGIHIEIDGQVLLDELSNIASTTWIKQRKLELGLTYKILVEYVHRSGYAFFNLQWQSPGADFQIIPSSAFFPSSQTLGAGMSRLTVNPGQVCASSSYIEGRFVTIATAGSLSTFYVISRDAYGNMRDALTDTMYARLYAPDQQASLYQQFSGMVDEGGSIQELGTVPYTVSGSDPRGNKHEFSYTPTQAGLSELKVDIFQLTTSNGSIWNIGIVSGGFNYSDTSPSIIVCDPPCVGSGFVGRCHAQSGSVIWVEIISAGSGYDVDFPPSISCAGNGSGLAVNVTISSQNSSFAFGSGLTATYYNDADLTLPARSLTNTEIDFSATNYEVPFSLQKDQAFSVRWNGLLQVPSVSWSEIGARLYAADERVRLWIAQTLIIDQWTSLDRLQTSGTIAQRAYQIWDILVEYKKEPSSLPRMNTGLSLFWSSSLNQALVPIPRFHLFSSASMGNSPLTVSVVPNHACATLSIVTGDGLSTSTAGAITYFVVQSVDAFSNFRTEGGDNFVARIFSDSCQGPFNGQQTCQSYGPQIGGTYSGKYFTYGVQGVLQSASCLLSEGLVQMNLAEDFKDFYITFTTGACTDRWTVISSYDTGTRCANLSSVNQLWPDGSSPCTPAEGDLYFLTLPTVRATQFFPPLQCTACPVSSPVNLIDNLDGTLTGSYVSLVRGEYTLITSLSSESGLTATYYDNSSQVGSSYDLGAGDPVASQSVSNIDWSSTSSLPLRSLSMASGFGVRWTGFIRPSLAQTYTFEFSLGQSQQERVKLWVDNLLIIDQWTSLVSNSPRALRAFETAEQLYDISALYKCPNVSSCAYSLKWESQYYSVGDSVSKFPVPSNRLLQRFDVPNAFGGLNVYGGRVCSGLSIAYGDGLTLAIAGQTASFTIVAKDSYGNVPLFADASFSTQTVGLSQSLYSTGTVAPINGLPGHYLASYILYVGQEYSLYVKDTGTDISGSPFGLVVLPGVSCGSKSTLSGSGLTATTVEPSVTQFQIQLRDSFGNTLNASAAIASRYFVRVVRTSGSNMQGNPYLPPFYGSTAVNEPGDIPTVTASLVAIDATGLILASYIIPAIPSPAGQVACAASRRREVC
eukprot:767583-Hanusia_phi.AAC.5